MIQKHNPPSQKSLNNSFREAKGIFRFGGISALVKIFKNIFKAPIFESFKKILHVVEGIISEIIFLFPSRRIKIIGVTGTDGKTTTTHLLHHILQKSGKKVSMISSIEAIINGQSIDTGFHTTTPRPFTVRKLLARAVKGKSEYFVLEVTSHAIAQGRVWGIPFLAVLITNITHDHLYFHKTVAYYFESKMQLLRASQSRFINKDCTAYNQIKKYLDHHKKPYLTFTTKTKNADYTWDPSLQSHLPGAFNKENIMAGYALCRYLDIPIQVIKEGIATYQLPKGRLDVLIKKPYTIIIDFAHTPFSILQLLKSIKNEYGKNNNAKLVHIFGAASERDDAKRPMMGESSSKYADCIILTEEDFRCEPINKINTEIAGGFQPSFHFLDVNEFIRLKKRQTYTMVENREDAIKTGLSMLQKDDILVITGKSHEKSLNRHGHEDAWDEYEVVKKNIKEILNITI